MASTTDSLKFEITADSSRAKAEINGVEAALKRLSGGPVTELQRGFKSAASEASNLAGIFTGNRLSWVTSQITSFARAAGAIPGPAGLAAGAIAGIATAATAAGLALFTMAKGAAEAIRPIAGFSYLTGLSAETTSALSFQLNFMHKELSDIQPAMLFFAKQMDAAAGGSDKAAAALKRLGVTQFTDMQAGLTTAFKTLDGLSNPIERDGIAIANFGKRGAADITKLAASIHGDFNGMVEDAKRLGVTLTEGDIADAKEFGHEYEKVMFQVERTTEKVALTVMPYLSRALESVSGFFATNQSVILDWANNASLAATGAAYAFQTAAGVINAAFVSMGVGAQSSSAMASIWSAAWGAALNVATAGFSTLYSILKQIGMISGTVERGAVGRWESSVNTGPQMPKMPAAGGRGGGKAGGADPEKKAYDERIAAIRRFLAEYIAVSEKIQDQYALEAEKGNISEEDLAAKRIEIKDRVLAFTISQYEQELEAAKTFGQSTLDIESKIKIAKTERQAAEIKGEQTILKLKKDAAEEIGKALGKEWKAKEDEFQKELKRLQKLSAKHQQDFFEWQKQDLARKRALKEEADSRTLAGMASAGGGGFTQNIKDVFDNAGNKVSSGLGVIGSAFQSLKSLGMDALNSLAQGVGNLVSSWVLMGNAGGMTFRKFTAQILAMVAQQAATLAVMSLAYAALATTAVGAILLGGTPGQFLAAAAAFGLVAVAAGVTGRLIAGKSFQTQNAAATSKAGATAQRSAGNGGNVYSSNPDQTVSGSRNRPGIALTLNIRSNDSHIVDVVKGNVGRNGSLRTLILDVAGT